MALVIDGVCASGALSADGETVAVRGCGISVVYPKEHKKLIAAIGRGGAIITEYPPMEKPNAQNFPKRNRIISGLCQGVIIVEGAMGSGALITASRAIAQGRDVFALPGKINESNSEGPNELIKNGANIALSSEDILNFYDFLYHDAIYYKGLNKAKKKDIDVEAALEKYGVSDVYYRGRYTVDTVDTVDTAHNAWKKEEKSAPVKVLEVSVDTGVAESLDKTSLADNSEALLSELDDVSRKIFENMPIDKAVSADWFVDIGISTPEIIGALTVLEMMGLASSLPGGLYIRK
jgi:predicted Rossmann fold nucleotide-binding protein DprA/Smf involved in DNA uptake